MYLFEVGLSVAVVLGLVLSIAAYLLLARALWPRLSDAAEARFTRSPVVCAAVGLPLAFFAFVASTKLFAASAGVLGALLGAAALGVALAGGSGVAARVGRALASPADAGREWAVVLRGGLVILLASLLPILGWFFILPIFVGVGLGASILGVVRPREAPSPLATEIPAR
jgi:hypothetical protein